MDHGSCLMPEKGYNGARGFNRQIRARGFKALYTRRIVALESRKPTVSIDLYAIQQRDN
ncbi:MAG: hypothetical protein KDI33_16765 [Halioglobus sp.]|nr:hypothetical protein [Halioglobus sp.]